MPKTEKESLPKSSRPLFRSSPRADAMLARLRYVGEHVFGGDMAAYAAAVGLTEHWLRRILGNTTRFRVSTFITFVESGIVAAEWLFCGTGPMISRPDRQDALTAFTQPPAPNSRYATFDPMTTSPGLPKKPKRLNSVTPNKRLIKASFLLAQQLFAARVANQPVLLFLGQAAVNAGIAPIVAEFIRRKYLTGIAMTGPALVLDYTAAKKDPVDISDLATAIKNAAAYNVGLGEAVGFYGFSPHDNRARSILAAAYDSNMPVTAHTTIGDSLFHLCPVLYGIEYGAALGSMGYVDALVFTAHVHKMSGPQPSLFIASGEAEPAFSLLTSAKTVGQRLPHPLQFGGLQTAWLSEAKTTQSVDHSIVGNYADVFSALLTACNAVYEGVTDEYVSHASRRPKSNRRIK